MIRSFQEICFDGTMGKIETERVRGHHGNEIVVFRAQSRTRKQAELFFVHFWSRLSNSDRSQVISKIEEYVDSSGTLYLRIGKQESCTGEILLSESDPIKVEVQFARGGPPDSITIGIRNRIDALSR